MPDEGLPLNKMALSLIELQPTEVSRGHKAESFKKTLISMRKTINGLRHDAKNGIDKITDYCSDLRSEVQLATEAAIEEINEHNERIIATINNYEKESILKYHLNQTHRDEVYRTAQELETFHLKWSVYLKETQICDDLISKANGTAEVLSEKAERERLNLIKVVFKRGLLKFRTKSNRLEQKSLGSLYLEQNTEQYGFGCRSLAQSSKQFNWSVKRSACGMLSRNFYDISDPEQLHAFQNRKIEYSDDDDDD